MSYQSKYCQVDEYDVGYSPITGRELRVNLSQTKILVSPEMVFHAETITAEWIEAVKAPEVGIKRPNKAISAALRAFSKVESVEDFMSKMDNLMEAGRQWEHAFGQKNHIYGWLLRLWGAGIIAVPKEFPFSTKTSLFPNAFMLGSCPWITDLQSAYRGTKSRSVVGPIFRVAGRTLGVKEPGDIVPETTAVDHSHDLARTLSCMVLPLLVVQRHLYGEKAVYSRASWAVGRPKRKVGIDRSFAWALEKDPSVEDWQRSFSSWIQSQRQGLALRTYMVDRALDYLISNPALPRSVEAYCRRDATLRPTWSDWAERGKLAESSRRHYTNYLADFFDWYLSTALTDEDDFGRPVPSPIHFNPITRLRVRAKQSETHREALPLRYIHELIRILTEMDSAWPKSLKGDYFMWKDPETGEFTKVWSPVRRDAIVIKLLLPLRTYQVRMLDSGEADSERYTAGGWEQNQGRFATQKPRRNKPVKRGFLRRFQDTATGREFTGFFVNTNKTADVGKDQRDRGYEIPWQHEEVIQIVTALRDWQGKYNPLAAPMRWEDIHDKTVLRSYSLEMLRLREPACFLFRDPCGMYPAEPVLDSRLQIIWAQLLGELERRVQARGERLANGEPIRFVTPQTSGVGKANYDLHTLRVSLITAYATEGGVPIQILSKCVAGHATILMTLYYNKPGPAHVSEKLAEAQQRIQRKETENFVRFLQNEEIRAASPLVVSNDAAGVAALDASTPESWVVGDLGICPVSGSMCHKGGAIQNAAASKPYYSPVPGGAKNCVRCRFFITGPAFLGGLVARFNVVGVSLTAAAERLRDLEREIFQLEDAQFDEGRLGDADELGLAYERRDRVLDEVDGIAHTWHAVYWLVERCKVALRDTAGDEQQVKLVLAGGVGDLQVALAECTDFELYDVVCQRAKVYPNESVVLANLRRGRVLDAMLSRSGKPTVFASLTESEALAVGNQVVELLMARAGRHDTQALIEGKLLLDDLGITKEVERLLHGRTAKALPLLDIKKKA